MAQSKRSARRRTGGVPLGGEVMEAGRGGVGDDAINGLKGIEIGHPGPRQDGDVRIRKAVADGAKGGQGHDRVADPIRRPDQDFAEDRSLLVLESARGVWKRRRCCRRGVPAQARGAAGAATAGTDGVAATGDVAGTGGVDRRRAVEKPILLQNGALKRIAVRGEDAVDCDRFPPVARMHSILESRSSR